jgi:inhibitor of KinA sporulation pathway (predicted exonuclease)
MRRGFKASGTPAHQVDLEQAILEGRALHLDMIGEVEAALEWASRDALIDVFLSFCRPATVSKFCCAVTAISFGANPARATKTRKLSLPVRTMS